MWLHLHCNVIKNARWQHGIASLLPQSYPWIWMIADIFWNELMDLASISYCWRGLISCISNPLWEELTASLRSICYAVCILWSHRSCSFTRNLNRWPLSIYSFHAEFCKFQLRHSQSTWFAVFHHSFYSAIHWSTWCLYAEHSPSSCMWCQKSHDVGLR